PPRAPRAPRRASSPDGGAAATVRPPPPLAHELPLVARRLVGYTRPMTTGAAPFFDAMAASYDELEPWYEHLYAVLHGLVRAELRPAAGAPGLRALDAGCRTGFPAAILLEPGYARPR